MQFYPADWRKDPQLQMCRMSTQGIWMNLLCLMWEAEIEGEIKGNISELCRVIGCEETEFKKFYLDIKRHGFGDITGDVTNGNGEVTIICRRMKKAFLERQSGKERVRRHREAHSNAKVTPPSSSTASTSSSYSKIEGEFVEYWNSKETLPKIQAFSGTRKAKLKARLQEPYFIENWRTVIDKVAASLFCCGDNNRGWKADCTWILTNSDNYVKVMEGKYDGRKTISGQKGQKGENGKRAGKDQRDFTGQTSQYGQTV